MKRPTHFCNDQASRCFSDVGRKVRVSAFSPAVVFQKNSSDTHEPKTFACLTYVLSKKCAKKSVQRRGVTLDRSRPATFLYFPFEVDWFSVNSPNLVTPKNQLSSEIQQCSEITPVASPLSCVGCNGVNVFLTSRSKRNHALRSVSFGSQKHP